MYDSKIRKDNQSNTGRNTVEIPQQSFKYQTTTLMQYFKGLANKKYRPENIYKLSFIDCSIPGIIGGGDDDVS